MLPSWEWVSSQEELRNWHTDVYVSFERGPEPWEEMFP